MHEYIHILYQQDDIISESSQVEIKQNERKMNQIAAEILMPKEAIKAKWVAGWRIKKNLFVLIRLANC